MKHAKTKAKPTKAANVKMSPDVAGRKAAAQKISPRKLYAGGGIGAVKGK